MISISEAWFLVSFLVTLPLSFTALKSVNFSKIFYDNKVWQIRLIHLMLSISLSFLVSYCLYMIINVFL